MTVRFRPAGAADAAAVAEVYLASRKALVSFAPLAHSDDEVRDWIASVLVPSGGVTVAHDDTEILGMMAISKDDGIGWIDHLYLRPSAAGRGIGSEMVAQAKTGLGSPIRLYTFQQNEGARRFYERHGFVPIAFGDGRDNEEKCPDILFEWNAAGIFSR